MDKERVFCSQQLLCLLPPLCVKLLIYLLNWKRYEGIKYYQKQMAAFLHIDTSELDQAIQTLINYNLLTVSSVDNSWVFAINKETIAKYFDAKLEDVKNHDGFKLATDITWNKEEKKQSNDINDMSDDEMKRMIIMLKARLNEKEQVKKVVVSASKNETEDVIDNLPF